MSFDTSIERVKKNEGGYVNDPRDPGGETNWGITVGTARAYGYVGAMIDMTWDQAKDIYRRGFWDLVHADTMPPILQFQVLDFAVNSGISTAIRKLQDAAGVADDGKWGSHTMAAVVAMNPVVLTFRFLARRQRFQTKLKNWPVAGAGWANRNADDMDYAADDLLSTT